MLISTLTPEEVESLDGPGLQQIYDARLGGDLNPEREQLWQTLIQYWVQRYVNSQDTVLDLAAGHCEFINNIQCKRKLAVDLNADTWKFAHEDVEVVIAPSHYMPQVIDESVDVVFVSNFFEHLPDKRAFLETLVEIKRLLKPGGKVLILQPNIRFINGAYWDFIDHYLPLTDRTLVEALELTGFVVQEVKPRFLPYTTKSKLPKWTWLVRLYLALPLAHFFMGKQAWVVARK